MSRRLAWVASITCCVALAFVVTVGGRRGAIEGAAVPEPADASMTNDLEPHTSEMRLEAEVNPPKTHRDVLREFWGDSWTDVESRLGTSGLRLDDVATIAPWEEAKKLIEPHVFLQEGMREVMVDNRVEWPHELTYASIRQALGMKLPENLSDQEIAQIALTAEPFNVDLRVKAETYVSTLDAVLRQQWARDEFQRSPFTSDAIKPPDPLPFYSTSAGGGGWSVVMSITKAAHPEFAAIDSEIKRLKLERKAAVRQYLANR